MPGTKLKIPFLNKEVIEVLEETESFISDYYPKFDGKINEFKPENKMVEIKEEEVLIESLKVDEVKEEKKPPLSENSNINIPKYNINYLGNIPPKISSEKIRKI